MGSVKISEVKTGVSVVGTVWDAPGTERKRSVRKGMVPGAWLGGAYLLLPASEVPPGCLYCSGTGAADAVQMAEVPLAPKQEESHAKLRLSWS